MVLPTWVSHHLCPALGVTICNIMFYMPFPKVMRAKSKKNMGDLNVFPLMMMMLNQIGWTTYGIMKRDFYIYFSSCMGIPAGAYYTLVAISVMSHDSTPSQETNTLYCELFFVFSLFFWTIIGLFAGIVYGSTDYDQQQSRIFVGTLCSSFSIAYYAAPLSSLYEIIRKRDASSLYAPLLIVNLTNNAMWVIYGAIATGDPNLWMPSLIGGLLSITELVLVFMFSRGHLMDALAGVSYKYSGKYEANKVSANPKPSSPAPPASYEVHTPVRNPIRHRSTSSTSPMVNSTRFSYGELNGPEDVSLNYIPSRTPSVDRFSPLDTDLAIGLNLSRSPSVDRGHSPAVVQSSAGRTV